MCPCLLPTSETEAGVPHLEGEAHVGLDALGGVSEQLCQAPVHVGVDRCQIRKAGRVA